MLKLADFCRCGNSLKVCRNCPTTACIGTKAQILSAIHRMAMGDSSKSTWSSNGSMRKFTILGKLRGSGGPP